MKKVLFSLMALAIALSACKKEEQIVPEIKADKTEITIPLAGTEEEEFFVEFSTNVEWTAAVDPTIEWCTITPKKGVAGAAKIKVVAEANTLREDRSATITVKAETVEKVFTLHQSGIPHLDIETKRVIIDLKGNEVVVPVTTNVKFTAVAEENDWLTINTDESSIKFSASENKSPDPRKLNVSVKAEGHEDLTVDIRVVQNGRLALVWSKKPKTDWADFNLSGGARMAAYGDFILLANGSKIFALNPKDGTIAQTISLPEGMKAQSLCVDDAGNVIFAANAKWAADGAAEMFRIYTTKSVTEAPKLLIEYNSGNIWCGEMGNVRVQGNIEKDAVITAYASYSAYWMAWEVKGGVVGALKCAVTPYTSSAYCGCVYPNGAALADGLWFIGYGGDYNLKYCADSATNKWADAYVTGSTWMENYDCISTAKVGDKKYMAISASCHFDYDSTDLSILDVTDPAAVQLVTKYAADALVERNKDYKNLDWTDAGTFADVCLVAKGEVLYLYFIDVNYGAAGCIELQ